MNSALIIFVRNPVLGKVKTRIAKDLGDEAALEIYKKLLSHTHSITSHLQIDRYVFYADYINDNDLWELSLYNKELQTGDHLGERMYNAFELLFKKGYSKVCVIGSDCVELTDHVINEAFSILDNKNSVIGPTYDGGYYLLGMSSLIRQLFQGKNWSTDTVCSDTIENLSNLNYTYSLLPVLSDVDNAEDCKRYSSLLSLPH
ncbi:MAG TPA: TIGR04282 family arsenosugar biosynthesis glycosyltransferase [Segetibacter sp.]